MKLLPALCAAALCLATTLHAAEEEKKHPLDVKIAQLSNEANAVGKAATPARRATAVQRAAGSLRTLPPAVLCRRKVPSGAKRRRS